MAIIGTFDIVVIGTSSGGSPCIGKLHPAAAGSPFSSMLVLEAGPDRTAATIREQTSQIGSDMRTALDWQHRFEGQMTGYGVPNAAAGHALGRVLGGSSAHFGGMLLRGDPEDYDEWDWGLRVANTQVGIAFRSGGTDAAPVYTAAGFDPSTALANGDWIRPRGHAARFEVSARTATTFTLDNSLGKDLPAGTFDVLLLSHSSPALASTTGPNEWVWNGTTTVTSSGGGGAALTEVSAGDVIQLDGELPFRVDTVTDDDTIEIENPLSHTIPTGTGPTRIAGPWNRVRMLDAYVAIENDFDHGPSAQHGGTGPIKVGRVGGIGGAAGSEHLDQRPNVVTDRIIPVQRAAAASLRDSAAGAAALPWTDDYNDWGPSRGTDWVAKNPHGFTLAAQDGSLVSGALGGLTAHGHYDKYGARQEAAITWIDAARTDPDVTVMTDAMVDKILFDKQPDGTLAVRGVRFIVEDQAGKRQVHVAKTSNVILSGGAFNSPAVLMRSGIGDPSKLAEHGIEVLKELPGVGANMMVHSAPLQFYFLDPAGQQNPTFDQGIVYAGAYRSTVSRAGAGLEVGMPPTLFDAAHDTAFLVAAFGQNDYALSLDGAAWGAAHKGASLGSKLQYGALAICQKPRSKAQGVYLGGPDPFDPVRVLNPAYTGGPPTGDGECAVEIGALILAKLKDAGEPFYSALDPATAAFQPFTPVPASGLQAVLFSGATFHAVGTCAMGTDDDPMAVCDERARVRGTSGLRISDNSLYFSQVRANSHLPTSAHGWIVAEMVIEDGAV